MLGFKAFLIEVKRTLKRSDKLVNYMTKRFGKPSELDYEHTDIAIKNHRRDMVKAKEGHVKQETTIQRIPINSVKPTQNFLHPDVVKSQTRGEPESKDEPIDVHEVGGHRYIDDGHHRWFGNKLRGRTHIYANLTTYKKKE